RNTVVRHTGTSSNAWNESMNSLSCNVLVVGAGIAGWTAAAVAAQRNRNVFLLDKSSGPFGDGNTLMTSGSLNAMGGDPTSDPEALYQAVMSEGVANPDLARAWADNCPRAVKWLTSCGIAMAPNKSGSIRLEPDTEISLAPVYRKDVGRKILSKLKQKFEDLGGRYLNGIEGVRLIEENRRITGLIGKTKDGEIEVRSRSTILSTGGFSANQEMVRQYIGPNAVRCKLRGAKSCTGDGLRMALAVGAQAVNLNYFYGHLISLKAVSDDRFWPYPRLDPLVNEGILINREGSRFVDEGRGDVAVANELAQSSDVRHCSLVFDREAWEHAKGDPQLKIPQTPPANPWLKDNDGYLYCCETVHQLADLLEVNRSNLGETLETLNRAIETGKNLTALPVPRTGNLRPLRPPFYGLRVLPGMTFTMGGILVNGRAQALNSAGKPITGLYAAGDAIGGLMGGYHGGYAGGLAQAIVTGMLAGEATTQ
ncbi:MAG TPA: FAD-binding protein, partial [Terriglobales bacterium]|nr:FAD-binding protein [Terriglobales bacterium]